MVTSSNAQLAQDTGLYRDVQSAPAQTYWMFRRSAAGKHDASAVQTDHLGVTRFREANTSQVGSAELNRDSDDDTVASAPPQAWCFFRSQGCLGCLGCSRSPSSHGGCF